jgi:hypothetical protein
MNSPLPHFFDAENARLLCQASAAAYSSNTIADVATDTALSIINCPLSMDTIVAFRGTADLRNWLTDLDCRLVPVLNFRVHRGFYEAMQAVELDLDAGLGQAPESRLWVTGHSLGGALAKLWALWAAGRGHDVAGVYTFGQPRVGDAAFASFYNSVLGARSFRVVHAEDIVPRVPWMLARYRHAGHEVFFPSTLGRDPREASSHNLFRSVEPCCEIESGFDGVSPYRMDLAWPAKLLYGLPALARGLAHGKLALLENHHINRYLDLFPAPREETCVAHS